ncbi:alpha-ketoacid dehydrogenase subunit beta [Thermodesulfobacteriota bacterium]
MSLDKNRPLQYSLAVNEALHQVFAKDKNTLLLGQGVKSPWYVGETATGLLDAFGPERIIDTPVSENAMTGAALGASLAGMRTVVVHPRMDFMLYAFDPIINEAANWSYMNGGTMCAPLVIWGIINRGGEQAAQHSQALHALFGHIPGLKVVMPSTPYDAKGLMVAAIADDNPVVYIDDRWLHHTDGPVPLETYEIPIGKGKIRRNGTDLTLVSVSYMMLPAMAAAEELATQGIDVEVIDLRTIKPLDTDLIINSVKKTGRLAVADGGWRSYGIAAEIAAVVMEEAFTALKGPLTRITLPDAPAPASKTLEEAYYIKAADIVREIRQVFAG